MHVWPVGGIGGLVATVTDIHHSIGVHTRWEQLDVLRRIVRIVSTTALSHAERPTDLCISVSSPF